MPSPSLAFLVLSSDRSCCSRICPGRLSTAWLDVLVVFFLSHGLRVVTREVHQSSLRRLMRPAQDHFILLALLLIVMIVVLSLQADVGHSVLACDVDHTSFHFVQWCNKFVQ